MARYQYMILSRSKPGQEDEYRRWYKEQHLPDVARLPGVVSGRLFEVDFQKVYDLDAPQWGLMTLYELDTDAPETAVEAIRSLAGSEVMPMTETLDKAGMIQAVGRQIGAVGPA